MSRRNIVKRAKIARGRELRSFAPYRVVRDMLAEHLRAEFGPGSMPTPAVVKQSIIRFMNELNHDAIYLRVLIPADIARLKEFAPRQEDRG